MKAHRTLDKEARATASDPVISVAAIRDHYDRLARLYRSLWGHHIHHGYWENGESPAAAQRRLVERLAQRAQIPPHAKVLDVGCGLGGSALWLARHLGCSVLGINVSSVQIALASQRVRAEKLDDRIGFIEMDANQLNLPRESFDVIWIIECSEHLADKQRFIETCARLLKPGGVLALCAWLQGEVASSSPQRKLVAGICHGMLCPSLATRRDYVGWMRASGFRRIEAEDITPQVAETWTHGLAIVRRPPIQALLGMFDKGTRDFVTAFPAMQEAYRSGAMAYGMFIARKACQPAAVVAENTPWLQNQSPSSGAGSPG